MKGRLPTTHFLKSKCALAITTFFTASVLSAGAFAFVPLSQDQAQDNGPVASKSYSASDKAVSIAKETIIVDGHIDVPYRVKNQWVDVTKATDDGDFDYPRAVKGGLNAPFMSIYVPASLDNSPESTQLAHLLIDSVEAIVALSLIHI